MTDDVQATQGMTELEREEIKKSILKVNAEI
jgi:hypothetical protein